VAAKVEFHFGELFPGVGFYRDQPGGFQPGSDSLLPHARRGRQWIKEGKQAVAMTRLSRHRFRANRRFLARVLSLTVNAPRLEVPNLP
jgi:hypothetical protein